MTIAWRLPENCLTAAWWLSDKWKLPDNCLTTAWRLPDNCLTTAWQLPDNWLTTACQLPDDCLTAAWWPSDDCLKTSWGLLTTLDDCLKTVSQLPWQLPDGWLMTAWRMLVVWKLTTSWLPNECRTTILRAVSTRVVNGGKKTKIYEHKKLLASSSSLKTFTHFID